MTDYKKLLQKITNVKTEEVNPFWKENQKIISSYILNENFDKFLSNPQIQSWLFMDARGELLLNQLHVIEKYFDEERIKTIIEDKGVGAPPNFIHKNYTTNHNNIHHLYHIARYVRKFKEEENLKQINTILEWGGGYGNFCKIFLNAFGKNKTYIIIDLPEMSIFQKWYLENYFPEIKTNLLLSPSQKIKEGQINLVPSSFYQKVDFKVDLFVSTWGLSESPVSHHDYFKSKNWYGSKHFLVSLHQCGNHIPFMEESTNLAFMLKKHGCIIDDIRVIPGKNYYIFK
jgi:uncharacterized protein (DUF3820 family)